MLLSNSSCLFAITGNAGEIDLRGSRDIEYCMGNLDAHASSQTLIEADQAYVYLSEKVDWVIFSKGAVGTFGKRSLSYKTVMSCAVSPGTPGEVIFLGAPLKDAIINQTIPDLPTNTELVTELFSSVKVTSSSTAVCRTSTKKI